MTRDPWYDDPRYDPTKPAWCDQDCVYCSENCVYRDYTFLSDAFMKKHPADEKLEKRVMLQEIGNNHRAFARCVGCKNRSGDTCRLRKKRMHQLTELDLMACGVPADAGRRRVPRCTCAPKKAAKRTTPKRK